MYARPYMQFCRVKQGVSQKVYRVFITHHHRQGPTLSRFYYNSNKTKILTLSTKKATIAKGYLLFQRFKRRMLF